jgi:hypothetical protein
MKKLYIIHIQFAAFNILSKRMLEFHLWQHLLYFCVTISSPVNTSFLDGTLTIVLDPYEHWFIYSSPSFLDLVLSLIPKRHKRLWTY